MKNLLLILSVLSLFASCEIKKESSVISAESFQKGIENSDAQLLDVRTKEEFNTGYIEEALHADWNEQDEFQKRIESLSKDKPVYVYCLGGGRSHKAMEWLKNNGFETVFDLKGGISDWKNNDLPVKVLEEKKGDMTIDQVEEFISSADKVMIDVGASWCPPCQKMKPIVHQLEEEGFDIMVIDGDKNDHISEELKVDAFPQFIVYEKGVEVKRFVGVTDIDELRGALK